MQWAHNVSTYLLFPLVLSRQEFVTPLDKRLIHQMLVIRSRSWYTNACTTVMN